MSTLIAELKAPVAQDVRLSDEALTVTLADGRVISAPLAWYPRLLHARPIERNRWRLIGQGEGIHWPDLDEDISVENLVLGQPSGESPVSLGKWLNARAKTKSLATARRRK